MTRPVQSIAKRRLDNGLVLVSESMPSVRSVSLGVWLRRGSRHEPAPMNGISHFIEHLVFKGTETRSARDIALAVDSFGGQLDAFTSKEYTCFYAKVLDTHLPEAVELLADIVRRPRFDPEEMERERTVIVEEIRMVEDTAEELIYDLFSSHFHGGHPLGRPIQGTERTIRGMTRARVLRYFRDAYRPGHILIAAAGNVSHARVARLVQQRFGSMEPGPRPAARGRAPRPRGGIVVRPKRELEQIHLLLGLPSFPETSPARYPLAVLNALLGGTMSSRLFQKIREERGLAYSVYSAVNAFADTGVLLVYAATSPGKARETLRLILAELRDLRDRGAEAREVELAKEHLRGSLMLSLESTSSRMSNLARQDVYHGRPLSLEDMLARIAAVTPRAVHGVARRLLGRAEIALAAVGRTGEARLGRAALRL